MDLPDEKPVDHRWNNPALKEIDDEIQAELDRMKAAGVPVPQTLAEHMNMMHRICTNVLKKSNPGIQAPTKNDESA